MAHPHETLRRLDALGIGFGWTCLLVGDGTDTLIEPVRSRIGPKSRLVAVGRVDDAPTDVQFDFVLARGHDIDLPPLVGRLWFGGVLLLEADRSEGASLAGRLRSVGLEPLGDELGAAHARRPQFITSY